tara:strand:- start:1667 stop:1876 length:210 start_codon:yes stop_codon:yes gene_type:complete
LQCAGRFFHLGSAADAVRRHALAVIGSPAEPAVRLFAGVERGQDLVDHARRFGRAHHFIGERFHALDHH